MYLSRQVTHLMVPAPVPFSRPLALVWRPLGPLGSDLGVAGRGQQLDVTMVEGGGLGGPKEREEGPLWPWPDPLWWLEDWAPPLGPTAPLSLGLGPEDLA